MKRKLLYFVVFIATFLFTSCGTTSVLKSRYLANNSILSEQSFDDVWEKVIDYFAVANLPISVLDKSSGLITVQNITIGETLVTMEDKDGKLINKNAWFVLPYQKAYKGWKCVANKVNCSFNVRVKEIDETKTQITLNIGNIQGIRVYEGFDMYFHFVRNEQPTYEQCVSTGVFENHLFNYIN